MYRNPYFKLINISGSEYLLPFGQAISDHKRGIKISRSGAGLWNMLENYDSEDELISECISQDQIPGYSASEAASDIKAFFEQLKKLGIVICEKPVVQAPVIKQASVSFEEAFVSEKAEAPQKVTIAGINLELSLADALSDAKFTSFASEFETAADITVHTTEKDITVSEKETILVVASEMTISESDTFYVIRYRKNSCVKEMYIRKAGPEVLICLTQSNDIKTASEEIFHAIRIPFLILAEKMGMYAIHSASVLYKEKAWLFSAPAGTGKSTHAKLWTAYSDATDINGDLNLIGIKAGTPTVFGIPWCGTSEIYTAEDFTLGGVVFLKQSPENRIEKFSIEKALVTLSRRTVSPVWNEASLEKMIRDLNPVSKNITALRLYCTKEPAAQKALQEFITNL